MSYQNVDVVKFAELLDRENTMVLDVRSPAELAEGEVPGYQMINFFEPDFKEKISSLDRSKSYLVYCRSGNRSAQACSLMVDMGFENLYNLVGGIGAWNSSKVTS
ncbi:MAG: rhodanese-like domain-containing protein [Ekhidna sp.]|nr:rhodanese-like domain-containing protein [Ekhidna sp.]